MALKFTHGETEFGVGDVVRVYQKIIDEGKKERTQVFEGVVLGFRNRGAGKSFVVRRVGAQKIGIEVIFPLNSPLVEKVEVKRKGGRGVRRAKLYYTRDKSKRETERIYSRSVRRERSKEEARDRKPKAKKKAVEKKTSKKN